MRIFFILIIIVLATTAFAQQLSPAKLIAAKYGDAVVTVKISVKMRISGDGESSNQEQKNEIIGTVISPDGIILVPFSATDPTDIVSRSLSDSDEANFKMNVELIELKVRTPEGLEIPGKVILRDQDMDLAFIKLNKKPEKPMKYVDINLNSAVSLLDDVVVMGRTGPAIYRSLCVNNEQVEVMVKKPQPFYILTHSGNASALGSPVFDKAGKFVGIMVLRAMTALRGSNNNNGPHAIVRPAGIILKSAGGLLKKSDKTVAKVIVPATDKKLKAPIKVKAIKEKSNDDATVIKKKAVKVADKKITKKTTADKSAVNKKVNNDKPVVKKNVKETGKKQVDLKKQVKPSAKKVVKTNKLEVIPVKKN